MVIIILGLLVTGGYMAFQISPILPKTFSRLATAVASITQTFIPGERLLVKATPESSGSGDEITLSWTHRNKTEGGIYSLSYECHGNVRFDVQVGTENKTLLCDAISEINSENSSVKLIAVSNEEGVTFVPLTLSYKQKDESKSDLHTTVNLSIGGAGKIASESIAKTAGTAKTNPALQTEIQAENTTPKTTTAKISSGTTAGEQTEKTYIIGEPITQVAKLYGKADLAPKILEVGILDKTSNQFTATTSLKASNRIAVRFEVENLGTASSDSWYFSAVLPTFPMHIFQSESQQSLAPGDRIEYTIGFDSVEPGVNGRFVINVDPNNSLSEATKANNIATTTIRASM